MKTNRNRPVSILIAALGGEGGGVLADWIIDAATADGLAVQSTSVPGVSQRTGATTYYVEVFPVPRAQLGADVPVFSLTPSPGSVDVVAATELVEAGRMMQRGFVDSLRTTLFASTHREYAVAEKTAMADGRYDAERILDAAGHLARRCVMFDMRALAQRHGTIINTVLFGAIVGAGALPLSRKACEDAIRHSGKAVDASLRGFAAGFEAASGEPLAPPPASVPAKLAGSPIGRVRSLPEQVRDMVSVGVVQTADYQNARYAEMYLARVERICDRERQAGSHDFQVTLETARYLALWMSYEDVIRVADLKTRHDRIERVRREVDARDGQPVLLTEYLKPGLDEICSMLPPRLSQWLHGRLKHRSNKLSKGLYVRTDTVTGFAMLCLMRSLRSWRPRTARYATEQRMIDRWLSAIVGALDVSPDLAHEIALCGNLVKGYGETSARGHRNLTAILNEVQSRLALDSTGLLDRVRKARKAALADPEGRQLAGALGLAVPAPKEQPIKFVRRATQG